MIDSAIPKRVDVYNPIITTANMKGVPLRIISMRKCNGFGDDINQTPFLYDGSTPNQLPPMARVLTVDLNNEAVAYPYDVLREQNIINDTVGGNDVVIFWAEGTASVLATGNIPDGREVGSTAVYSRVVNGTTLNFEFKDGKIFDTQSLEIYKENNLILLFPSTTSGSHGLHSSLRRRCISRNLEII